MKITATITEAREIEFDAIRCVVAVRYDEEDMPNDYPHRKGDIWDITIDVATGQIRDWPKGVEPRHVYMKVCDEGTYCLMNGHTVIGKRKDNYVPSCLPGEYGDYIDFHIDAAGKITNWEQDFDADEIPRDFFGAED